MDPGLIALVEPVFEELHVLTNLLLVNIVITGFVLILVLVGFIYLFRLTAQWHEMLDANLDAQDRQDFLNHAQRLEDSGKYEALLKLANERIESQQGDLNGKWYRGISLFRIKRYGEALQEFSDLQEIDSAWNREVVEGYIEDIRGKMIGPQNSTT